MIVVFAMEQASIHEMEKPALQGHFWTAMETIVFQAQQDATPAQLQSMWTTPAISCVTSSIKIQLENCA
jgi:hypothetical protein